jgi:hypothetical protein
MMTIPTRNQTAGKYTGHSETDSGQLGRSEAIQPVHMFRQRNKITITAFIDGVLCGICRNFPTHLEVQMLVEIKYFSSKSFQSDIQ